MNVLLVSQCSKRALTETRRILDQFAERRGERTWQTPITQIGLETLRKMLKKTARKNTAVACHWLRGRDHSELLWIVGDARRFNEQGAVPTNTTERDILRRHHENDWLTAEDIRLLAVLASLFHDFGKASRAFQQKLTAKGKAIADAYRHEWVSLRLFESFVGSSSDLDWLERLANCGSHSSAVCLERLVRDFPKSAPSPFRRSHLPPLAQVIGWLIVSHHRLPLPPGDFNARGLQSLLVPVLTSWNGARENATEREKKCCWDFSHGLPFASLDWCRRAQDCARSMLKRPGFLESAARFLDDPYVMHLSRLALMLADHRYSSESRNERYGDPSFPLHANTDRETGELKQRLDEHLAGVASHARRVVRALPRLDRELPRIARARSFQRRSADARFRWQDKAYDLASSLREQSAEYGFFGVNMASTGCGKTLANGRILYGLANPQRGARFTIALGLRSLTLQTGEAYRTRLKLGEDDLAVLVGGGAVRELFEMGRRADLEVTDLDRIGSESAESLLDAGDHVHYEGSITDSPLKKWLENSPGAMKLVQAPVLVCTIDHLMPATESLRGGRQIAPMLRLLTSDLVLDEPDDFDLGDLPALSRLVHWAGLLGSRVVLSSATLPPSLVEGLFDAYRAGRSAFQKNRGNLGRGLSIPCAWFDEYGCKTETADDVATFRVAHNAFVDKRLRRLREAEPRRKVQLVTISSPKKDRDVVCGALADQLPVWMTTLHERHHVVDPKTDKRASFGLVRMANIDPLITVAQNLFARGAPEHTRIHLCVYHARHPLLIRSSIERLLDRLLQRGNELAIFEEGHIRQALDSYQELDHLFVVLASPVAEVGRDHDYDWAIVEPSSMRSIIQLAGRIRRHREGRCREANVFLLNQNVRALTGQRPAFTQPGFEGADHQLEVHALDELLSPDQLSPLDAGSRIRERTELQATRNLVDLEHRALRALVLGEGVDPTRFAVPLWWQTRAHLTGVLQREQRFRTGDKDVTYAFLPADEGESVFSRRMDDGKWVREGTRCSRPPLRFGPRVHSWGAYSYDEELDNLAATLDLEPLPCAKRFGTVQLEERIQGWEYHPVLGFQKGR